MTIMPNDTTERPRRAAQRDLTPAELVGQLLARTRCRDDMTGLDGAVRWVLHIASEARKREAKKEELDPDACKRRIDVDARAVLKVIATFFDAELVRELAQEYAARAPAQPSPGKPGSAS